jgi:hypothetical protein
MKNCLRASPRVLSMWLQTTTFLPIILPIFIIDLWGANLLRLLTSPNPERGEFVSIDLASPKSFKEKHVNLYHDHPPSLTKNDIDHPQLLKHPQFRQLISHHKSFYKKHTNRHP